MEPEIKKCKVRPWLYLTKLDLGWRSHYVYIVKLSYILWMSMSGVFAPSCENHTLNFTAPGLFLFLPDHWSFTLSIPRKCHCFSSLSGWSIRRHWRLNHQRYFKGYSALTEGLQLALYLAFKSTQIISAWFIFMCGSFYYNSILNTEQYYICV